MRIAEVVGKLTLNRSHPSLANASLRLAIPLTLENLRDDTWPAADTIVFYDQLGVGNGCRIMLSEGPEAAQPFLPEIKPVDAYNAGILDDICIRTPDASQ